MRLESSRTNLSIVMISIVLLSRVFETLKLRFSQAETVCDSLSYRFLFDH